MSNIGLFMCYIFQKFPNLEEDFIGFQIHDDLLFILEQKKNCKFSEIIIYITDFIFKFNLGTQVILYCKSIQINCYLSLFLAINRKMNKEISLYKDVSELSSNPPPAVNNNYVGQRNKSKSRSK